MGSEGSRADRGIPAAWAAAINAALEAEAAAEALEDEEGLDRDLGGGPPALGVRGDPRALRSGRPLLSPQ